MRNIIKSLVLLPMVLAVASCQKPDSDLPWGNSLIYMPQANYNPYVVPNSGTEAQTNRNYSFDKAKEKVNIFLGVYRSGLDELKSYTVDVNVDGNASEGTVSLPENVYSIPSTVTCEAGKRDVTFYLTVDMDYLRQNDDRNFSLSVSISNPTRYSLNEKLSVAHVMINTSALLSKSGIVAISKVETPVVTDFESYTGTTASVSASYSGYSIGAAETVAGWFVVTDSEGRTVKTDGIVNADDRIVTADLSGLEPDGEYTVEAYVSINDDEPVKSDAASFLTSKIKVEITGVNVVEATGLKTEDGSAATLNCSYTSTAIPEDFSIMAGFSISAEGVAEYDVPAVIDRASKTFSADLTGLVAGTVYTVNAWVKLNDEVPVEGESSTFNTLTKGDPITVRADFTTNDPWKLRVNENGLQANDPEKVVTDNSGYVWKFYACIIKTPAGQPAQSLWCAPGGKTAIKDNGYIILPQLKDHVVTKLLLPNTGPGNGSGHINISVSTDEGKTFVTVPGYEDILCPQVDGKYLELKDQKPGSIYKITCIVSGADNAYIKLPYLEIVAE